MKANPIKKYGLFLIAYIILACIFFYVGGEQIKYRVKAEPLGTAAGVLAEISEKNVLCQSFTAKTDTIDKMTLQFATYGRENQGDVYLSIRKQGSQEILVSKLVNVSLLQDNQYYEWEFDSALTGTKGSQYELIINSNCPEGEAPTLYYRTVFQAEQLVINGEAMPYELFFSFTGKEKLFLGMYYWQIVVALGVLIVLYHVWSIIQKRRGKLTWGVLLETVWERYQFLIKQLVSRDFKTKYKRSMLGYLWSFLNPLLTMAVQYVVFSTIFRSDIKNFPVYLLSGIIIFNFFSDAVGQGLGAIVVNSALITKVYVPKYIYPITKVVSCSINLLISIIPLLIVVIITGTPITKAIILVPYALICLIIFCIGLSLALSSAMVFFRDTQYLWGIFCMIWMYATPLFYPETIIPEQYRIIQKINPLYHIIKFVRVVLIEGVSPDPMTYLYCMVSAVVACVVGAIIFKKTQDRFVLYI